MSADEKAILLIPDEVRLELKVQMIAKDLRPSEKRRIARLISECTVSSIGLKSNIEQHLRIMSGYIAKQYRQEFEDEIGLKAQYLRTSDARILHSAFSEDGIIVTRNIKDFLLYLVMNDQEEEVLYDIADGKFVQISAQLHETIHQDQRFCRLFSKFIKIYELQGR